MAWIGRRRGSGVAEGLGCVVASWGGDAFGWAEEGQMRFGFEWQDGAALRPADVLDAEALYVAVEGAREALAPWLGWVDDWRGPVDAGAFLRDAVQLSAEYKARYVTLWLEESLVGMACLDPIDVAQRSASVGWWLTPAGRGRGLATRAARALISDAFARLRLARVEARMVSDNAASVAVAERLRMTRDGVLRQARVRRGVSVDVAVYSLLAKEWQAFEDSP